MTSAGFQRFHKKYDISVGCFNSSRINPRNNLERNISLCIYIIHFCLIWISNATSFIRTTEESRLKFKVVDDFIFDKYVKRFVKFDLKTYKG